MKTRDITFPAADGHPMRAAIAIPDDGRAHAGVMVIHEVFGLTDDIRRITGRFADLGYAAIAPDLYDGYGMKLICIMQTMRAMNAGRGRPFDDLDAARKFLQAQAGVDSSRIGAIGFCMGGGFALLYAVRSPLRVTATFYGAVPQKPDDLKGVCPVLGGYGARDRMFAPKGERLGQLLTALGVDHDVKMYPDSGHSYMNQDEGLLVTLGAYGPMKVGYNPRDEEDSWKRIEAFFGKHLGSGSAVA
jgi:carboxymethylenebutenolidase